jgi:hypothetical protein
MTKYLGSRKQGLEVTYFLLQLMTLSQTQDKTLQEISPWKNHRAIWPTELPYFSLYEIDSLFLFIFSFSAG